jgi:hypothetical protein
MFFFSSVFCIYAYIFSSSENLFLGQCCLVILILLRHIFYHSIEWFEISIVFQMINIAMREKEEEKKRKKRTPFFFQRKVRITMNVKCIRCTWWQRSCKSSWWCEQVDVFCIVWKKKNALRRFLKMYTPSENRRLIVFLLMSVSVRIINIEKILLYYLLFC